jgi:hypothetical protein
LNLSNRKFTNTEIKILSKGLKFSMTPFTNPKIQELDILEFGRRLKLKEFFYNASHNEEKEDEGKPMKTNKSTFTPSVFSSTLKTSLNYIQSLPLNSNNQTSKSNVTRAEREAINSLSVDSSIVIKEADKGSLIVIMDKSFYKAKIENMLNDKKTYSIQKIVDPDESMTKKKIKAFSNQSSLMKKEKDFLYNFDNSISKFYGLPKVHKSKIINEQLKRNPKVYYEIYCPNDLEFRPIVYIAGPNCIASHLSELIDVIIKPLVKKVQSFLKDTWDFLEFLPKEIDEESTLVTLDVASLYTNIDHVLGLEAIEYWLEKFSFLIPDRISTSFIKEGITIILKNNYFQFDEITYHQIRGTAMGTRMAPTYATLVLGYIEETVLYPKIEQVFGKENLLIFQRFYKRFIDDCFFIKNKCFGNINDLSIIFNNLHQNLKFTIEESDSQINFLDVLIKKDGINITTDIFYKPTDSHLYLHFHSCHPSHVKRSIPYNMMFRIARIVSEESIKNVRFEEMKKFLLNQKYPISLIDDSIKKVKSVQSGINKSRIKDTSDNIAFVSTYNPNNKPIDADIKSLFENLKLQEETKAIFENKKLIISKRQDKSIKKMLTKAQFSDDKINIQAEVRQCNDKRCKTCQHLIEGSTIQIGSNIIKINKNMACNSTNLIYFLKCNGCSNAFYIRETGDTLRHRTTVHRQQINTAYLRNLNVSKHIWECAKNKIIKFQIMPIFKMTGGVTARRLKENDLIKKLKPTLNQQ